MKLTSQSRDCSLPSASFYALVAALAFWSGLFLQPAFAAPQIPPLTTNNVPTVNGNNNNAGNSGSVRYNYFLRYPFAKDAWNADARAAVGQSTPYAATGGTTSNPDANIGTTGGTGTNQTERSLLNAPGTFTPLTAYKPMNYPGTSIPQEIAKDTPLAKRDNEIFKNEVTTYGLWMSDTQFQAIERENYQRSAELLLDPERWTWTFTNTMQMMNQAASNSLGGAAQNAFSSAATDVIGGPQGNSDLGSGGGVGGGSTVGSLINVANEQAGVPVSAAATFKTIPQAVWMVQQMYHGVFVPLAILFLLPGAVISQVKVQVQTGFNLHTNDGTTLNPFEGIIRSVIAIFLIPATQLIVSYAIDTGNSMAYSVNDWVNFNVIMDWASELAYNIPPQNVDNAIIPPVDNAPAGTGNTAGGGETVSPTGYDGIDTMFNNIDNLGIFGSDPGTDGLGANNTEQDSINEQTNWLNTPMQFLFNMVLYMASMAVIILGAFQVLLMCYLFLLGPLAAAFFAWPALGTQSQQALFRQVFSNWLYAVINVALWRFYWMVILAIMTQRILYITNSGTPWDLQWEVAIFACLLGLMMYVPFNPFNFDPSAAYQSVMQSGSQLLGGQSGGGGQQGGISGAAGAAAIAGGANPNQVHAMQSQIGHVTDGMAHSGQMMQSAATGSAPTAGGFNQGSGSAQPQSAPMSAPPPAAQPSAAPTQANAMTSAPPTAPSNNVAEQALQTMAPTLAVNSMGSQAATPSLEPANGATPATPVAMVNGNVTPTDVAQSFVSQGGTPETAGAPPMAVADAAPITNTSTSVNTASDVSNQVASFDQASGDSPSDSPSDSIAPDDSTA